VLGLRGLSRAAGKGEQEAEYEDLMEDLSRCPSETAEVVKKLLDNHASGLRELDPATGHCWVIWADMPLQWCMEVEYSAG